MPSVPAVFFGTTSIELFRPGAGVPYHDGVTADTGAPTLATDGLSPQGAEQVSWEVVVDVGTVDYETYSYTTTGGWVLVAGPTTLGVGTTVVTQPASAVERVELRLTSHTGGAAVDATPTGTTTGAADTFAGAGTEGLVPDPGTSTGKFLKDDGTWAAIAGGGDMLAATYDPGGAGVDVYARANHTGTQLAATVSDFSTAVGADAAVAANTAKVSADGLVTTHSDVSSAGSGAIVTTAERGEFHTDHANRAALDLVSGTNTGDEAAASDTVSGVIELATQAEVNTGTDAIRAVTPATLTGWAGGGGAVTHLAAFDANDATFPAADPAAASSRNGHPILAFDDTTDESVIFHDTMSNDYSDDALTVDVDWVASAATTGDVGWDVAFERITPGGQDIDSDGFAAVQSGSSTTSGTSGIVTRTSIAFTQAQADAMTAGDAFRVSVTRDTGVGSNMTGDAQVLRVSVRQ